MLDLGLRAEDFRVGLCWICLAEVCGGEEYVSALHVGSWPQRVGCKRFQTGLCWI